MSKSFTLHDLPKEERPRERLTKFGEQALSAQELLQLILRRGIAGESVAVTSQKLLSHFGSLQKLSEANIDHIIITRLSENSNFENLRCLNKPKDFQKIVKMAVVGQSDSLKFRRKKNRPREGVAEGGCGEFRFSLAQTEREGHQLGWWVGF